MKLQFRVLYRQFLFRMVDIELLSAHAQGDMSKLFGQFAALLLFISLLFSVPALGFVGANAPALEQLLAAFSVEHFLIATTMLVVGLFAVLSWDSTFPDRRDVLILSPLPVSALTFFLARVAAIATALSLAVALLHVPAGLAWPLGLNYRSGAQTVPAFTYDPPAGPVDANSLESMLSRELAGAQKPGGPLAPGTGAGLAIGIVKNGSRRVFTFGTAKPNSMFEIGSISKTFTGLLLAQMVEQGKVRLDEPVRELLPEGTVAKPSGKEITLLDLATQQSGLPLMPGNMNTVDKDNPYSDYRAADLYDYLAKRGVRKPADARFLYSNLGFGLLGQALADRGGAAWPDLVRSTISGPLGMTETVVSLSSDQQKQFIQGHDGDHRPVHAWDVAEGLAGAGALRSSVGDMLTYLEANLHPEKLGSATAGATSPRASLSTALRRSHQLQADAGPRTRIALGWLYNADSGTYYHSGGTGGYSSYSCFNPKGDYAVIVLLNSSPSLPFADLLGEHIRQRLAGEPALSLGLLSIPASGGISRFFRLLAAYWITVLAAGTFVFCCVLGMQGLVAQLLPRRWFLRVSSFLQLAVIAAFVSVYFLHPMLATPETILQAQSHGMLSWSPSYWFLGFFQHLSGSPALAPLARRAWIALAIAGCGAAAVYLLSYFRMLRRIVEEPDIVPLARGSWLPGVGSAFGRAVVEFSMRTLMRSRRHRVILAFYLGTGLAITIYLLKGAAAQLQSSAASASGPWQQFELPLLAASIVMMGCWIVGTRAVFSLPLDLRANWIFRVVPLGGGQACMAARRRSLFALSVAPVCAASAVLFFSIAPWRMAVEHLVVLVLLSIILAELCLGGEQRIPFTCSYLPGKSNFHLTFWLCVSLIVALIRRAAEFEQHALEEPRHYASLVGVLAILAILARWRNAAATLDEDAVQFEAEENDSILVLGLHDAEFSSDRRQSSF
jgi:CubicO group peptidase (beta-lactamase class C family)